MGSSRILFLLVLLPIACAQPVQQDRSIRVSGDGKNAAFQGDGNAIFVKDLETGEMKKIFNAPKGTLATSAPRWDQAGRRLVFCTAQPSDGKGGNAAASTPADGVRYGERAVNYTCWLFENTAGKENKPTELFSANCDHVGYIGADLAVRWNTDGTGIDYVDSASSGHHTLYRFDLQNKSSKRIFWEEAEGLVFDRTPDGKRLYCLLGTNKGTSPADGLWIEEGDRWWHVPETVVRAPKQRPPVLEHLRRARPIWSGDSQQFAFVSFEPGATDETPGTYRLRIGDLSNRQVEARCTSEHRLRDIHWHPDNRKVGVLVGREDSKLYVLGSGDHLDKPVVPTIVREFAGWSASGDQLAYVAAEGLPGIEKQDFAFLFVPNSPARSSIYVANRDGGNPRQLVSGLRATFLRWTPKEEKLSIWLTFEPTYRTWMSTGQDLGLRAGDPAAILDVKTSKLDWMPVQGFEKAQLGHYHLLRKEFDRADEWYQRAMKEMTPKQKDQLLPFQMIHAMGKDRQHTPESEERASRFYKEAPILRANDQGMLSTRPVTEEEAKTQKMNFPTRFTRDGYLAEVFLSLDDLEGGSAWFANNKAEDESKLSAELMFTQFLLMQGKWKEYVDCLSKEVLPAWIALKPSKEDREETFRTSAVLLASLPLGSGDFLAKLSTDDLNELKKTLIELREKAIQDDAKLLVDRILKCVADHTKDRELAMQIEKRLPKREKEDDILKEELPKVFEELRIMRGVLDGNGLERLFELD